MKTVDLAELLRAYKFCVFTVNDAARIAAKKTRYISLILSRNKKYFGRIERGKYYLKEATIYEIASGVLSPSYVSRVSALRYYNLISQMPSVVNVIASVQHKPLGLLGYTIVFSKLPRERMFGYGKDEGAMIAEPEKAIVDSLYMNDDYSYVREAVAALGASLRVEKLMRYAIAMDSGALINKAGFLLEDSGLDAERLLKFRSGRIVRLSPLAAKLNRKWRVLYVD